MKINHAHKIDRNSNFKKLSQDFCHTEESESDRSIPKQTIEYSSLSTKTQYDNTACRCEEAQSATEKSQNLRGSSAFSKPQYDKEFIEFYRGKICFIKLLTKSKNSKRLPYAK